MKFSPTCEIEKVTCKDFTRPNLNHVYLDTDAKVLVATNGQCMAVVPVELDAGDTTGPVAEEALAEARKLARKALTVARNKVHKNRRDEVKPVPAEVHVNGACVVPGGATYTKPDPVTFPPYGRVIPTHEEGTEGTFTVGIDAHLLVALAEALGSGAVKLVFNTEDALCGIHVKGKNGAYGVLMPMRI